MRGISDAVVATAPELVDDDKTRRPDMFRPMLSTGSARPTRRVLAALTVLGAVAVAVAAPAAAGGRPFSTELTGEAEVNAAGVPNQGDLDGTGAASLTINPGLGEICWTISVDGVEAITAAHIHVGDADEPGPVVVPLTPYTGGCTDVDRDLALAIMHDPAGYYVNVHNAAFPAGALRGQLG